MDSESPLKNFDLSVYLVTDSERNHTSRSLVETIEDAIIGGATIIQLREKDLNTEDFVALAKKVHEATKKHNVPLIINDNIDVLLAIDAEGLHIGQDDIPCSEARTRLGPAKIIGVSVETPLEAEAAIIGGADYLGVGCCYKTGTKDVKGGLLGHIGVRAILETIPSDLPIKTVGIGGVNVHNARRLIQCSLGSNHRRLDGIAIVSAIVSAPDARDATAKLLTAVTAAKAVQNNATLTSVTEVLNSVPHLLKTLREKCPLVHHITNYVVMTECANCTLALGGSPTMSTELGEMKDLSEEVSSVVINLGTLTSPFLECMIEAGKHANALSKPVIMDPVAVGSSTLRREVTKHILNSVHVDIIKGNSGEISAVAEIVGCPLKETVKMRGVDSVGDGFSNPGEVVRMLAEREHCVVVMTGKVDYVSDGRRTVSIKNGHPYQAKITGSGCMVGSVVGAFAGISPSDHFAAGVAGILCNNLAGEHAGGKNGFVNGPGSFRVSFIDELANLDPESLLPEFFKVSEI